MCYKKTIVKWLRCSTRLCICWTAKQKILFFAIITWYAQETSISASRVSLVGYPQLSPKHNSDAIIEEREGSTSSHWPHSAQGSGMPPAPLPLQYTFAQAVQQSQQRYQHLLGEGEQQQLSHYRTQRQPSTGNQGLQRIDLNQHRQHLQHWQQPKNPYTQGESEQQLSEINFSSAENGDAAIAARLEGAQAHSGIPDGRNFFQFELADASKFSKQQLTAAELGNNMHSSRSYESGQRVQSAPASLLSQNKNDAQMAADAEIRKSYTTLQGGYRKKLEEDMGRLIFQGLPNLSYSQEVPPLSPHTATQEFLQHLSAPPDTTNVNLFRPRPTHMFQQQNILTHHPLSDYQEISSTIAASQKNKDLRVTDEVNRTTPTSTQMQLRKPKREEQLGQTSVGVFNPAQVPSTCPVGYTIPRICFSNRDCPLPSGGVTHSCVLQFASVESLAGLCRQVCSIQMSECPLGQMCSFTSANVGFCADICPPDGLPPCGRRVCQPIEVCEQNWCRTQSALFEPSLCTRTLINIPDRFFCEGPNTFSGR